ncbi:MAG TPA: hypothetical protein VGS62_10070 [Streptosporangiaceae bacterium]|nr:hypothetical protein [Streptosporangiaceae bacterium]
MDIRHQIGSAIGTERPRRRSRLHAATTAVGTACVAGTASVPAHAAVAQPARPPGPSSPDRIQALAALTPPATRPFATTGPSHATSGGWL